MSGQLVVNRAGLTLTPGYKLTEEYIFLHNKCFSRLLFCVFWGYLNCNVKKTQIKILPTQEHSF